MPSLQIEYKGLDLVWRDWSLLTQEASKQVLKILFEGDGLDGIWDYILLLNESINKFE